MTVVLQDKHGEKQNNVTAVIFTICTFSRNTDERGFAGRRKNKNHNEKKCASIQKQIKWVETEERALPGGRV